MNPRLLSQHTISNRADSAALARLRVCSPVRLVPRAGNGWPRGRPGFGGLSWQGSQCRCWVRRPGPAQRPLVNRVRAGRQQLSAGMAVCRSQPGRRTEHRTRCQSAPVGSAPMADDPFVSLYRRFRPGRFDELRGQDHVVRALAKRRPRRSGVPCLPVQRAPRHGEDVVGPHPGQGAQLRGAGRRRAVRCLHVLHRNHPGHVARRPRAGRRVQQWRRRHAGPRGPRRAGNPGTLEGLHRRRSPHAVQCRSERPPQDARGAAQPCGVRAGHHRPAEGAPDHP